MAERGHTRSFSSKLIYGQCKSEGGLKLNKAYKDKMDS